MSYCTADSPAAPPGNRPKPEQTAEAACRLWYEEHGEALYRYLRFHLPTADSAEDLTAEVFLRAIQAFDRFNPSLGSSRAWLFRIAHNALRDYERQTRRRTLVSLADLRDLECNAASPEERLLLEEEIAGLLAAFGELSARDREIIGLSYASNLSLIEAGAVLGISATAARTRLWRALNRLRKVLSP